MDEKLREGIQTAIDYLEWYFYVGDGEENPSARNAYRILRNAAESYIKISDKVLGKEDQT